MNIPSLDGFLGHDPLPAMNIPSLDGFFGDRGNRGDQVNPPTADRGSTDPIQATSDAS